MIKQEIENYLGHLCRTRKYNNEECYSYWSTEPGVETDCGICTRSADLIAKRFNGEVYGYHGSPNAKISPGGHDFALVGGVWLVDWWAAHFSEESEYDLLHLVEDQKLVYELYGSPGGWDLVRRYQVGSHDKCPVCACNVHGRVSEALRYLQLKDYYQTKKELEQLLELTKPS